MICYRHGLTIGKFYPPHDGHHAMIRDAAAQCEQFTVLVMAAAVETIALSDRVSWLQEEHEGESAIRVIGIRCDAPLDVTNQQVWIAQVALMRAALCATGEPVDVDALFSGEQYGAELARRLGAVDVRIPRTTPSGSALRRDLAGRWSDLAPPTRAGLTVRVVVVGAESTGTTTVAGLLAEHYVAKGGSWAATQCVEEYGREYTRRKWDRNPEMGLADLVWTTDDFDAIALEQTRREQATTHAGSPVLICDTDAFATAIWERRYPIRVAHATELETCSASGGLSGDRP